jgi:hypothetical protein
MPKKFSHYDLIYALDNAAEFLENEQWPEDDGGAQEAANREAAKMIRAAANKVARNAGLGEIKPAAAATT